VAVAHEGDELASEGLGRLLTLADGVFAIAATLLVIEIAVPEGTTDAELPAALVELWPHYFAYALSFLVIARFWTVHHLAFRYIQRYDGTMVWLNLVLLMLVAFLPFPTSVLGRHGGSPVAALFYGTAVTCTSAVSTLHWWYVIGRAGLLRPGVDAAAIRQGRVRTAVATGFFALSLPLAWLAPYAAELAWVLGYPVVRLAVNQLPGSRRPP
jgi:uncharacterized membrane protein